MSNTFTYDLISDWSEAENPQIVHASVTFTYEPSADGAGDDGTEPMHVLAGSDFTATLNSVEPIDQPGVTVDAIGGFSYNAGASEFFAWAVDETLHFTAPSAGVEARIGVYGDYHNAFGSGQYTYSPSPGMPGHGIGVHLLAGVGATPTPGVLKVLVDGEWRKVGCGDPVVSGRLRMQLPDGSWMREHCDGDLDVISDDFTRADSSSLIGGPWTVESGVWGIAGDRAYLVSGAGGIPRYAGSPSGGNYAVISVNTGQPAVDLTVISHRDTYDGYGAIFFAMERNPTSGIYLALRYDSSHALDLDYYDGERTHFVGELTCTDWNGSDSVLHVEFDPTTLTVAVHQDGTLVGSYDLAAWSVTNSVPLPILWGPRVGLGATFDTGISSLTAGERWDDFTTAAPPHPLKIDDPASPGSWIPIACMSPVG